MVFTESIFLFAFLPAACLGYAAAPARFRNLWLVVASAIFYAFYSVRFLPLLWASSLLDWALGRALAATNDPGRRKALLGASITLNLGVLGFFKYGGFIADTLAAIPGLEGVPRIEVLLPLGISFYTFQSMSYTIDLYRGVVTRARGPIDFLAYVTFFPQLVAGPIVRFRVVADQLEHRVHTRERVAQGLERLVLGLAKKVWLADTAGLYADQLFRVYQPGAGEAWLALALYAAQIYFDFSAYSDMAIGLARLFGFEFPENFRSPYQADSFSDFWRRWHITLSEWLRDNLYVPLGGNRKGRVRTYVNLMLTMLLGGLWHGASWKFVLWGAWHGLLLAVERFLRTRWPGLYGEAARVPRRAAVLVLVVLGWAPFRCADLDATGRLLGGALGLHGGGAPELPAALVALVLLGIALLFPNTDQLSRLRHRALWAPGLAAILVLAVTLDFARDASPFLYFAF